MILEVWPVMNICTSYHWVIIYAIYFNLLPLHHKKCETKKNIPQYHLRPWEAFPSECNLERLWSSQEQVRARCGSIGTHMSIPQDFYQSCNQLGARHIECELVTYHQTYTQALSKALFHSMVHRRLWEIIQLQYYTSFPHICYVIPLCLPLQYPFMASFGNLCLFYSHMTCFTCDSYNVSTWTWSLLSY